VKDPWCDDCSAYECRCPAVEFIPKVREKNETVTISGRKFAIPWMHFAVGWLHDCIYFVENGQRKKYMERWVLRAGWITIRRHRIYTGDDRMHDHPFAFITFPLDEYTELVRDWTMFDCLRLNKVKPYRFHYRPRDYVHQIIDMKEPVNTLVIAGPRDPDNRWGFYDEHGEYTPHEEQSVRIGQGGPSG
jgi:hypothetical protein